jgi:hypothetical protein
MSQTRRLAAMLAADIVGYSRLMSEDEAGTAGIARAPCRLRSPSTAGGAWDPARRIDPRAGGDNPRPVTIPDSAIPPRTTYSDD